MENQETSIARAWSWIPSLYFTQGLPNVAAATVSVVMYKNLGVSNDDIAFYTSWLYIPWVIKPLWSPLVELLGRKRFWIVALQFVFGAAFASVAWAVPGPEFFRWTLALFWLAAFASATHDIAADGFYLLALPPHQQAEFVGVRSTFFKLAVLAGQGGLVMLAGHWAESLGVATAWSRVFLVLSGLFVLVAVLHRFVLPLPDTDGRSERRAGMAREWWLVFVDFFRRKQVAAMLLFLLFYRFAESQLVKLAQPFLLDGRDKGGLGLTTAQVGGAYGTMGTVALLAGGLLGGWLVSRHGLRRWLWPMAIAINVPNLVYVYFAAARPESFAVIAGGVAVEQFGYGFGFTAYMLYMMIAAEGRHRTAHYAICTGFMALGMMLPGMKAGWLQEQLGYLGFFGWVCLATIPSFVVTALVKVDDRFGRVT